MFNRQRSTKGRWIGAILIVAALIAGCAAEGSPSAPSSTTATVSTSTGDQTVTSSSQAQSSTTPPSYVNTSPTPPFRTLYCGYLSKEFYSEEDLAAIATDHPVLDAVITGDTDRLETLLDDGESPDDVDEFYAETALTAAIESDCGEAIDLLLDRGADPSLHAKVGFTPVEEAINRHNNAVLQRLVDLGADLDTINNPGEDYLPIIQAAGTKDLTAVNILLAGGADPNIATWGGTDTALQTAIAGDWMDGVEALIAAGADTTDAAFSAIDSKDPALLRYLLEHGASADGPGNFGPHGPCPGAANLVACYEAVWPEGAQILKEYGGK